MRRINLTEKKNKNTLKIEHMFELDVKGEL